MNISNKTYYKYLKIFILKKPKINNFQTYLLIRHQTNNNIYYKEHYKKIKVNNNPTNILKIHILKLFAENAKKYNSYLAISN